MMLSNQAKVDETAFPFRNKEMIEKYQSDQSTDILFQTESNVKWIPYNPLHISNYTRVHFDPASDLMVMRVNTAEVNARKLGQRTTSTHGCHCRFPNADFL